MEEELRVVPVHLRSGRGERPEHFLGHLEVSAPQTRPHRGCLPCSEWDSWGPAQPQPTQLLCRTSAHLDRDEGARCLMGFLRRGADVGKALECAWKLRPCSPDGSDCGWHTSSRQRQSGAGDVCSPVSDLPTPLLLEMLAFSFSHASDIFYCVPTLLLFIWLFYYFLL